MGFIRVCSITDIPRNGIYAMEVDGQPVGVCRASGSVHAFADACSHADVFLSDGGEVRGTTIECWLHGSCFDLRTGEPTHPPATQPIRIYAVQVVDDQVYVDPEARMREEVPPAFERNPQNRLDRHLGTGP